MAHMGRINDAAVGQLQFVHHATLGEKRVAGDL